MNSLETTEENTDDEATPANSGSETTRGIVSRVTYRNPENGYTVLQLSVADKRERVTVVGYCLPFAVGSNIVVHGEMVSHPRFGEQLQATAADEIKPTTAEGIEKYLGSGLIPGVGPKTAENIVEKFGDQTLEVIYRSPERLTEVSGVSAHRAEQIAEALQSRQDRIENERFFIEHDISIGLSRRIIEKYGSRTIAKIQKDPYRLAFEMKGIGFATADAIALNIGFDHDAAVRLRGGLYYALQKAMDDGHCFLPRDVLIKNALHLLGIAEAIDFDPHIESLSQEGIVMCHEEKVYILSLYEAERFVAEFVANRIGAYETPLVSDSTLQRSLEAAASELDIAFSYEQRAAVESAVRNPLLVITGGPGCGKTTIIRALAATFTAAGKVLALAAPTGKAAQRMAQVTGMDAKTIHRLLKYDPYSHSFQFNGTAPIALETNGIEERIDALIIDEASMLDIQLARDLFVAVPSDAPVILVGDKDQLPSVGPGRVFAELVSTKEVPVINLSTLFRRSNESRITSVAHTINSGLIPELPTPDGITKSDVYFIHKEDSEAAARVIESLVAEQIPAKFDIPLEDITVLTPSNRGPIGTLALNERLQERINPTAAQKSQIQTKKGDFRLGDRVCQRVNNYKIDLFGVFNGDIGQVYSLDESDSSIVVELWDGRLIRYSEKDLGQLSLSYAMTVHRSQGSELPCVVLALHSSHFTLLERQLLYTAVTRAKQLLIVVGSQKALRTAIQRVSSSKRRSSLKEHIAQNLL